MDRRLELHEKLLTFLPNVYFQPPSNISLEYPCIIYNKGSVKSLYGDNSLYLRFQQYNVLVIDRNPDSDIALRILESIEHCTITSNFVKDNLNQTALTIYY